MNYEVITNSRKIKLMSNTTLLSIAFLFSGLWALAQPPHEGESPSKEMLEKMKAHKIAYITEKLSLTPDEAQVFWPVYNEKEDKLHQLREANHPSKKQDFDSMSDSEIEDAVNKRFEMRQAELVIEKQYHEKFKAVLPIKKVAKLYKAEHNFKRDLLKKLRERQNGGGSPNGRHH